MLTNMVLKGLEDLLPKNTKWRILVTSGTKQGIDSLIKGRNNLPSDRMFDITVAYFPFDAPYLMEKAFSRFAPKLAVIVETELWPGFLITAKKKDIPILLINGRMSAKSFGSYKYFSTFFHKYGPDKVMAISPADGERFAQIVGPDKVSLINNIKFDRIETQLDPLEHNPIADFLPTNSPFLLFGSIRKQEEQKIVKTIKKNPHRTTQYHHRSLSETYRAGRSLDPIPDKRKNYSYQTLRNLLTTVARLGSRLGYIRRTFRSVCAGQSCFCWWLS